MNQAIFSWLYGLSHRSVLVDDIGIFFAQYLAYLLVLGFLFLVFDEKGWRTKLFFFLETVLAVLISRGIVTEVIRFFYRHPRPMDALGLPALVAESGNSFPSGHMTFFFALATVVFFWNKKWGIWYMMLSLLMGVARVFAGVHWPLDIIGGALIGIICAASVHFSVKKSYKELKEGPTKDISEGVGMA